MQSENEEGCVIRQCVGKKFPAKALGIEMFSTATIKSSNNKKRMSESTNTHICFKVKHWDNQSLQFCQNSAPFAYSWDVGCRLAAPCSWLKARQDSEDARSAVLGFPAMKSPACAYQGTALETDNPAESTSMDWEPAASTPAPSSLCQQPWATSVGDRNFVELINVMLQTKRSSLSSRQPNWTSHFLYDLCNLESLWFLLAHGWTVLFFQKSEQRVVWSCCVR